MSAPTTYADRLDRVVLDADSHIMELPEFIRQHADAQYRDRLPRITDGMSGRIEATFKKAMDQPGQSAEAVASMQAMGPELVSGPKGYEALGAFNAGERSAALDQLGFHRQLVFTTFAAAHCFWSVDPDLRYAAARGHNRSMIEFCGDDPRMMGVAAVPTDDPANALAEAEYAVANGLGAVWLPHSDAGGRSPGHDELDQLWAFLAEAGVPFLLHVGGRPLQLDPVWMNTGREVPTDWHGGGENVRAKDMTSLHHAAETFLGCLVLDGVLERHPQLRGGAIELGAGWVPSFLNRLDWSAGIWKRTEPELATFTRKPSEQVRDQLAFTPYVYEDVGALIDQSSDELYLFSSDYPHHEGSRDPIGKFEAFLDGHAESTKDRFYTRNFEKLFGDT